MMGDPLLDGLSEEQRAVVLSRSARTLVLAGAGSGKTRALVHRLAHLLRSGAPPGRVLLMTFTAAAAREMIGRAAALLGDEPGAQAALSELWAGTFHHVALRLLRRHGRRLGLPAGFGVLDRGDAEDLLGACVAAEGAGVRPRLLCRLSTLSASGERPLEDVVRRAAPHLLDRLPLLSRALDRYARRKLEMGALDFDDLLLYLRLLFLDHPDVAAEASAGFQHLLVDEYQDTSPLEAALVDELARAAEGLLCVGDDAQAIYRFRGGDVRAILDFPARWPGAEVLFLSTNYRSGPPIVALANASIAKNRFQHEKTMRAERGPGPRGRPALVPLLDETEQAAFVAARAAELLRAGRRPGDLAVLYRAHAHAEALQRELARRHLPFRLRSGAALLEQAHVKDALCHLRLVANPRDGLALRRALSLRTSPRQAAEVLGLLGSDEMGAEGGWAGGPRDAAELARALAWAAERAGAQAALGLAALLDDLCELEQAGAPPGALFDRMLADYEAHARRSFLDAEGRLAGLRRLGASLRGPLREALGELSLRGAEPEEAGDDVLTLSTVHRAKGLEWPVVFLIGLSEGRFPAPGTDPQSAAEEIEEERRLFYVAVTRARDELYLCCPGGRASRFVRELDGPDCPFERWHVVLPEA